MNFFQVILAEIYGAMCQSENIKEGLLFDLIDVSTEHNANVIYIPIYWILTSVEQKTLTSLQ